MKEYLPQIQHKAEAVPVVITFLGTLTAWSDAVGAILQILILGGMATYWICKALKERRELKGD